MEMQQVRYFLSLARTLNFTRAAEECNVSQPSLTRAIRLLEEELGGELLRRERRQSHLTELGQRMLPLLQQCYDSAVSAKKLARSIKTNEIAPVSVAVSRAVNLGLLMKPVSELARVYPGIQLKVKRGTGAEISELLKDGEAEIAVAGPLGDTWERLDAWPVVEERFELVLHPEHPLAGRDEIELGDLAGHQFATRVGCELAEHLSECLGACGIQSGNAHEVDSDHDLIALLEANIGMAVVPASAPRSERLRRLPIKDLELRRTITVYGIAGRRRSAAATSLLNLLRAADWSQAVN
jgi:DNA-binding transcriptional LysR family regulator